VVLQIQVANPSNSTVTLTSLKLTASGSGNDATGITNVSLYRDTNKNGVLDSGDTLITSGTYGADNGTLTLSMGNAINANSTADYLVVYSFSTTAQAGTYQVTVVSNADVSGTGPGGQNIQITGAPVSSSVASIVEATLTPTPVSVTSVKQPYPNPSAGNPVNIDVYLKDAGTVSLDVFTTAFRKVRSYTNSYPEGKCTLVWDLKDKYGSPASNGLYYLRIQVTGTQTPTKIFKILIIR
jgi:hypothetical protein